MKVTVDMIKPAFSMRNLFYFCYALVLLAVLLYVRFPGEKFKLFSEKQVEHYLQVDKCTIAKINYSFPFAVTFENIRFEKNANGQKSAIEVAELVLTSQIKGIGKKFTMGGTVYGGSFQSDLQIQYEGKHFLLENVGVSGVQVENLLDSLLLEERKTRGSMNFQGMYKAPFYQPFDGQGEGNVDISDGSIQLSQPILGLSDVAYDKLQFHVSQDKDRLKLDGGSLASAQLKVSFAGDVILEDLRIDSLLKISGTMEPANSLVTKDPAMQRYVQRLARRYSNKTLPFRIDGTIKTPTFRFGR